MRFANRAEAGRQLARLLAPYRHERPVVVGLPRGGVPVAAEVAAALGAPLDVIVVRKLGVPFQPELGMGAVGEGGVRVVNAEVVRMARITERDFERVEARERAEVERRAVRFRGGAARVPLAGRTVIVVDDGIATGSTVRAACRIARAEGAAKVVVAVPVAPPDAAERLRAEADVFECLATPAHFSAVGEGYVDFTQTTDDEVVVCLAAARRTLLGTDAAAGAGAAVDVPVDVEAGTVSLPGRLVVPVGAKGLVVFVHGSGSSRHSPRNRSVAAVLNEARLGTLLFDLLRPEEGARRANVFDIDLLAARLSAATAWLRSRPEAGSLPVGYFGASTGAAAALWAAAEPGNDIAAVVSRGGRPDLAAGRLGQVTSPTLLIVGSRDEAVLDLNRWAQARLRCDHELAVVPGATHLFEEPGTLAAAASLAQQWFLGHLPVGTAS